MKWICHIALHSVSQSINGCLAWDYWKLLHAFTSAWMNRMRRIHLKCAIAPAKYWTTAIVRLREMNARFWHTDYQLNWPIFNEMFIHKKCISFTQATSSSGDFVLDMLNTKQIVYRILFHVRCWPTCHFSKHI